MNKEQVQRKLFLYDPERERRLLNQLIIAEGLPFDIVESRFFRDYIQKGLCPEHRPISRSTCVSDAFRNFEVGKHKLKAEFSKLRGRASLTLDFWSSQSKKLSFCCITAHWVDDEWMAQRRIVSFQKVSCPLDGREITSHLFDRTLDFGISGKIFSVGLDNVDEDKSNIGALKAMLNPPFEGEFLNTQCVCHILNLVVEEGLDLIKDQLARIREGVEFITSSNKQWQKWLSYCESSGVLEPTLYIDIQHRWDSTYKMLEKVLHVKGAFTSYCRLQGFGLQMDEDDWTLASKVEEILCRFYKSTLCMSVFHSSTSNEALGCLFVISGVLHKYENDVRLREFVASAKSKLQIYWGGVPMLYIIGLVLDPTFKLEKTKNVWKIYLQNMGWYEESHFQYKARCVETFLKSMYRTYKTQYGRSVDMCHGTGPSSITTKKRSFWMSEFIPTQQVRAFDELEQYMSTSTVSCDGSGDVPRDFNVLAYWKRNKSWWPILAAMARDVLVVPVSTVASEQAFFGSGKNIVPDIRSHLSPKIMETRFCLQDWISAEMRTQDKMKMSWLINFEDDLSLKDFSKDLDVGQSEERDEDE